MTIGERIKQRREILGMSQDELAKKCGYKSRSSINKIELSRDLPLRKVVIMAEALETTPEYLMGWDNNEDVIVHITPPNESDVKEGLRLLKSYRASDKEIQEIIESLLNLKK